MPLTTSGLWRSAPGMSTPAGSVRTARQSAGVVGVTKAQQPLRCWTRSSSQSTLAGLHVCGLREDGVTVCWGKYGGDYIRPWSPSMHNFIAIFSQSYHTCGIEADGSSLCWINGLTEPSKPARQQGFAALSRSGLCDLDFSGEITCLDWYGGPVYYVLPGERLRYMGSSWDSGHRGFICGIRPDGSAACSPVSRDSDLDWHIPTIPSTQKFLDIGAGHDHACGLLADGSIKCWGSNFKGEGLPPPTQPGPPPAPSSDVICNPGVLIVKGSGVQAAHIH